MKTSQNHIPSLLGSLLFVLGALFLLGIGLLMGVTAFASLFTGTGVKTEQTIFFVTFGFEGIVLLLATFFTFQKFLGKPAADRETAFPISNGLMILLIVIAAASLLLGYQISKIETVNWIVLPILTIPAVVLPLGLILGFGTRRLPMGTRWQTWSVLGLSMTLAPVLLFTLEIAIAIFIFIGIIAYVMSQPELARELQAVSQQIMILGPQSEEARALLTPYITKPSVIVLTLTYIGVLVPAIEEMIKPIGVWLLAGKLESTAQGFTLGALSGAGYALIETIGVSGQQTGDWATLLFSRIGTGLLHITTSALMGAAIVFAWRERRYLRLLGTYLLAILLHGLWNTLAILFTFSSLAELLEQPGRLSTLQPAMTIAMFVLAAVLFTILLVANQRMRKGSMPPPAEPLVPIENLDHHQTP